MTDKIIDTIKSKGDIRVLSASESVTLSGNRFYAEANLSLGTGATEYVLFQMPEKQSSLYVGLETRQFKSANGDADLEILWDSTGVSAGVDVPIFNQNNGSQRDSKMTVKTGVIVTGDGTVRETDFLAGSIGAFSSGDIAASNAFRLYAPGTFFIAKITNTHTDTNRIKLSYSWIETYLDSI